MLLAAAYLDDACTGCHMEFQPTVLEIIVELTSAVALISPLAAVLVASSSRQPSRSWGTEGP